MELTTVYTYSLADNYRLLLARQANNWQAYRVYCQWRINWADSPVIGE